MPLTDGWETLGEIKRSNAAELAYQRSKQPVDCPNDGTPLVRNSRTGQLGCPFDGWRWNED